MLSSTLSVCTKLSLWACFPTRSTPLSRDNSGKISGSNPQRSNRSNPIDGTGDSRILFSSVTMRSFETIEIRSRLRSIASKVSGSMSKPSWAAKRTARIIRNGSSENVVSGSHGVLISSRSKSPVPSNGSINCPNVSPFSEKAIALIVKSRRSWSSSIVPFSTIGLRESAR